MAKKTAEPPSGQQEPKGAGRKPWKKKSPVQVVLDQITRLQEEVAGKEEELKHARRQLQKLEEARKVLETT